MPHREFLRRHRRLFAGRRLSASVVVALALQAGVVYGSEGIELVAPADVKPVFLVTEIVVGEGVPNIDKDTARDVLATRFGRLKDKIEVRSLAEVKATIDQAAMAQLIGSAAGDDDLGKLDEYVQVDRMVFGRITQVAGITDIQVKVFNVKEGVTEVAFARRLGKGAEPSVILALLDGLADQLTAWVLDTYTDGAPDPAYQSLKAKKLGGGRKKPGEGGAGDPWSLLGVSGAAVGGAGISLAAFGVIGIVADNDASNLDIALCAAGAGATLLGVTMVVVDGMAE